MASDREYLDITIFVEGHDGKKRPCRIGYAWMDDRSGDLSFKLETLPVPGARTDFSGKIQKRDRNGAQGGSRQSSNGGGGRQSAPQSSGRGSADFGPGAGDADELPF